MKDYYNILGVQPNASDDDIRTAYKKLAMKHHPDRGGNAQQFQEIQEAHSVLTDPERKAQWEQQKHFQDPGGSFGFSFNFGGGPEINLNDILRGFHGGPFRHHQVQRNRDLKISIDLDLASTLDNQVRHIDITNQDGTKRTVQVNIPRGVQPNMQMRFVGSGENHIPNVPAGDLYVDFRISTPHDIKINGLNLNKKIIINAIDAILGTKISVSGLDGKQFDVQIPPGTQPNTQFRIHQQGLWDVNHPFRGDLFIEILLQVPISITSDQYERIKRVIA